MSYEPRGKMQNVLAAMREAPQVLMASDEIARLLDVMPKQVASYTMAALDHGALYSKMVRGRMFYKCVPFTQTDVDAICAQPAPWSPPRMVAPRPGSDGPAPILTKPAPLAREPVQASDRNPGLGERSTSAATASGHEIPDSASTPRADDAAVTGQERQPDAQVKSACEVATVHEVANEGDARVASAGCAQPDEKPEAVEFTAAHWLDGDLVIYGAQELEDGGILITKDQLARLKRLIAWSAV